MGATSQNTNKKSTFLGIIVFTVTLFFALGAAYIAYATPPNLILNPSLETPATNPALPQYWQKGGTGNNTRALTYPVAGVDGVNAAKTEITTYTDGDAKWYFQNVAVTPGATYQFSDMYTSTTVSHVTFRYTLSNGSFMYPDLQKNIPASASWTQFQKTFIVPTSYAFPVQSVTIFHLIKSVGSITVDAYDLHYIDSVAPSISVDAITGQPVSGFVSLSAQASDNVGVASVQFFVDGGAVGAPITASPFSYSFDTSTLTDGTHSVTARASDEATNTTLSAAVSMETHNNIAPTTGTLLLKKHVINDNAGSAAASAFSMHVYSSGIDISGSPASGSEAGTSYTLVPGNYTVGENSVVGYDQTGISGDCSAGGVITIVAGQSFTCTITNNDTPPPTATITVNNVIINDNGGTKTLSDFPLFVDTQNVASGESTVVSVGTHNISEITDPNYTRSISGNCDANGVVTVAANESKVCTITNDDIQPAPPVPIQNFVPNPSVEVASSTPSIPANWQKGGTGTNTRVLTYPVAGYDGVRAAKTDITAYTNGDAKWYFATVPAASGQQYTFSDYSIATTTSYVTMQYKLSDGTFKYADIITNIPAHSTWTQVTTHFTIPTYTQAVVGMTVFHLIKSVGSITVDNYSLTTYVPPATDPSNLIINPSVETASQNNSAQPEGWAYTSSSGIIASATYPVAGYDGTKAVQINASAYTGGAGAKWYFQSVAVTAGQEYRFSDYYKSTANSYVTAQIQLTDGSYMYMDLLRLVPSSSWKKAEDTFIMPPNAQSLMVFHILKEVGSLTTDNYMLKPITGGAFSTGMVTLNFDDGLLSVYQNAMPILNATTIKSSHYMVTSSINNSDSNMTSAQMLDVNAHGNEIGAHTQTHPHLTQLTLSQAQTEIAGSKVDLASFGVTPNSVFVYPYGDYNDTVRQLVVDAGFVGARSVHRGYNTKNTDKFALRDQTVEADTTPTQIIDYIQTAMATNTWLILELHDTNNSGDQYSNTPETLQAIVNYLVTNNIPVVTTAQGIVMMN